MKKLKQDMITFALKAGDNLLRDFKNAREIYKRGHIKDLKTVYDLASDRLIKKLIEKNYPTHNILTEETGYIQKDSSFTWIVDPLDGTSNFINRNPFFSVSIALKVKDKLVLGVVYAPFLNELYTAERCKGAFLNGKRIKVSSIKNIEKSYLVSCEGGERDKTRKVNLYKTLASRVIDVKKLGSAAIECGWVSTGRADGYVTLKISPWDVAAGILIVEEAGGKVTDFKGNKWNFEKCDLIVSNGKIHNSLLKEVKDV
jgi:myo-inositol-1(or 4)-monophosphatase